MNMHLAGIIPVANLKTDFDIDTPEILLPVNAGFTAIQKSVFECAMAGCETIWIVANDDLAPIVRKRVGEWTYDPLYYSRSYERFPRQVRKEIPIYYVPVHPKDRDRRDSYGWSVLYGIFCAWWVGVKISKWMVPQKYFISFPMNAYNIYFLRDNRKLISDIHKNFFMTDMGKTVKDNIPLPFTMFGDDYIQCRRWVNKQTTKQYCSPPPGEKYPSKKLPFHERWSARNFDFSEVFEKLEEEDAHHFETEWFYDISTWDGYVDYISSGNLIRKPFGPLTKTHKHNKLLEEEEI
jgi:hypothetical protein